MRYLYTAADDQLFAHAPGRRDFFQDGDDLLWAHESHGWLVAAQSGETLAHRTGDVYYGAVDGERLYRVDRGSDARRRIERVRLRPNATQAASRSIGPHVRGRERIG